MEEFVRTSDRLHHFVEVHVGTPRILQFIEKRPHANGRMVSVLRHVFPREVLDIR